MRRLGRVGASFVIRNRMSLLAACAAAAGIEMSTHLYPELAAHLMRVTETAHWLEWQDWAAPILAEPFSVADSCLTVPNRPGAGIAWNEYALRRYRYDA